MENWRFWFRYTQQGSNWKGNETKTNFSETEIFLQGKLNWQLSEDFELAFGGEYPRDDYGPGWNEG